MKKLTMIAALSSFATFAQAQDLKIVTDIAPVYSIAAQVAGDRGTVDLILPQGASAHDYAMRPSEAHKISQADVVIWVGEALSPWLEGPIETLAPDAQVIELMALEQTQILPVRKEFELGHDAHEDHDEHDEHDEHGEHEDHEDHDAHEEHEEHEDHDAHEEHDDHEGADGHAGHHHGDTDPHVWLDPENAKLWADEFARIFSKKDPTNADYYAENSKHYVEGLNELIAEIQAQIAPVQGRAFVVSHDALNGFESRFGMQAIGAISDTDDRAPSAKRLAHLRDVVKEQSVRCMLVLPGHNQGLIDALDVKMKQGQVDPLGSHLQIGAGFYEALLRDISAQLVSCLSE